MEETKKVNGVGLWSYARPKHSRETEEPIAQSSLTAFTTAGKTKTVFFAPAAKAVVATVAPTGREAGEDSREGEESAGWW